MKKLLLLNVAGLLAVNLAFGQMNYAPSAAQGLASGSVGTAYSQDISFTVPDSVPVSASDFGVSLPIPPFTAAVTSTVLTVEGLPNGLTASCSVGSSCDFATGVTGTITISGTPTEGGTFSVKVASSTSGSGTVDLPFVGATTVDFPGTVQGQNVPAAPGILDSDSYTMDIAGGSGSSITELNTSTFDVVQNVPNPFTGNSVIKFSTPTPSEVDFKVFDVLGKQVFAKTIQSEAGVNAINLNAVDFSGGAYFYTVSNGEKSFTKRMIVSAK